MSRVAGGKAAAGEVRMGGSAAAIGERRAGRTDESVLTLYLKEINRIPLLSRQEEEALARRAAKADKAAKEELARANLRFVVNIAKKYQNQGLPLPDLISEGNIGLLNAIDRFDVEKGYHFISYAVWWIRQSILKAICEKSRMIRLPLNRANELIRIERMRRELEGEGQGNCGAEKIAARLAMNPDRVAELLHVSRDQLSLDMPMTRDRDSALLGDMVGDKDARTPDDSVVAASLRSDIDNVLGSIGRKESDVLRSRYGFQDGRPQTLREIGTRYRLTKERIRQIEKRGIKQLRHPSRSVLLRSYVDGPRLSGAN
jgi:RNA polymerase primary sigma factor